MISHANGGCHLSLGRRRKVLDHDDTFNCQQDEVFIVANILTVLSVDVLFISTVLGSCLRKLEFLNHLCLFIDLPIMKYFLFPEDLC